MTSTPTDLNQLITISVYLRRDQHENGMTLTEYADAIIAGTHPVLEHDEYVYQFGAISDELDLVVNWAQTNNLTVVESEIGTATVKLTGTVGQFNSLFKIQLEQVADGDREYMTHQENLAVPDDINDVVELILGLDNSSQIIRHKTQLLLGADPTPAPPGYPTKLPVDPVQVATAYNMPAGDGLGETIAIIEFQGSGWNQSDVNNTFAQISGLPTPTVTNKLVNGATASTVSDGETMMDIWCAGGVAPKSNIVVYFAPLTNQGFVDNILAVANDTVNNPSILSISWGYTSEPSFLSVGFATAFSACVAKGILVFISSGDEGGNNWVAQYPSTSQYVISCGGTSIFLNNNNSLNAQTAWSGSSGGISAVIPKPSWQSINPLYSSTYTNSTQTVGTPTLLPRRGVPDMSAPSDPYTGYQFYVNSVLHQDGGTSAAAPFLAGCFARLNSLLGRRIQFGELMNLLYGNPSTTTDITVGQNNRSWHGGGFLNGYATTVGWDAATGLGSPNGQVIYNLLAIGIKVKTADNTWNPVANVRVKTGATTWSNVRAIWTKTISGWRQTY